MLAAQWKNISGTQGALWIESEGPLFLLVRWSADKTKTNRTNLIRRRITIGFCSVKENKQLGSFKMSLLLQGTLKMNGLNVQNQNIEESKQLFLKKKKKVWECENSHKANSFKACIQVKHFFIYVEALFYIFKPVHCNMNISN